MYDALIGNARGFVLRRKEGARIATLARYAQKLHHAENLETFLALLQEAVKALIDAQHVFVFLADTARSQLWTELHRNGDHCSVARTDMQSGSIGMCYSESRTLSLDDIPSSDGVLQRLLQRVGLSAAVIMHPIVKDEVHEKLGVVVAVDKTLDASSILFDETYAEADKATLALFCRDVYDLLVHHAVEISFVSALSTVLPNGQNANTDSNALLQSQLLEYTDLDQDFLKKLRFSESARYSESDGALSTLIQRSSPRSSTLPRSLETQDGVMKQLLKRSDLGPIDNLRTWNVHFIDLPTEELVKLCFDIFLDVCPREFGIKDEVVVSFLTAVASHYRANPYHTFLHACYVLHSVWMMLTTTELPRYLLPYEKLALFIAAVCHDVDHDGLTNQFHINSGSEVARRYNDVSVLENHHCTLTFAILERKNCAILEHLSKELQTEIRRVVIQYIMSTDMSHHFKLTSELCQLELPQDDGTGGQIECPEEVRLFLCKAVLHASDISNPVRSFEVDYFMAERVQAEFRNQTQKERELGLPVLPHMDIKTEAMKYQAEVNFIDFIVTPLWSRAASFPSALARGVCRLERLSQILPSLELCIHQMNANRARFAKLSEIADS